MRIESMTATFGKLHTETLTLQPGLNLLQMLVLFPELLRNTVLAGRIHRACALVMLSVYGKTLLFEQPDFTARGMDEVFAALLLFVLLNISPECPGIRQTFARELTAQSVHFEVRKPYGAVLRTDRDPFREKIDSLPDSLRGHSICLITPVFPKMKHQHRRR